MFAVRALIIVSRHVLIPDLADKAPKRLVNAGRLFREGGNPDFRDKLVVRLRR